jgi:transposase
VVDSLGNPVYLQLSGGNIHDATMAVEVLTHVDVSVSTVLADKAYGTKEILDYLQINDADYAIPPKSNTRIPWRCDWWLYKERHLVECFFLKLKNFRRIATRYDKLASSFLAFVYLASSFILLK